ncbi:hypothetical protein CHS0354_011191 [Potamilus streckersoni]|uniref:Nuclear envelope membrane protein n=1 Tax=Potamilus streckersoni TaxID=2493646 RepID=A0AAE0S1M2_9BIVA|nr:hypothetical protein CHS0354_011191 [Potamilus streckersoni]
MLFVSKQTVYQKDTDPPLLALFTIDACLVVFFMAVHSGLASDPYRNLMKRTGMGPLTRSFYVLLSALTLKFVMNYWEPIPELSLWFIDTRQSPLLWLFFTLVHAIIWSILVLECLMLEPLHLLGIKQVWYYVRGHNPHYMPTKLKQLLFHMPHAGIGGFTLLLWLHPCMTLDRLIMATIWTPYVWLGQYTTQADYIYMKSQVTTESYTTTRRLGQTYQ